MSISFKSVELGTPTSCVFFEQLDFLRIIDHYLYLIYLQGGSCKSIQ